jgi:hypothetical protein
MHLLTFAKGFGERSSPSPKASVSEAHLQQGFGERSQVLTFDFLILTFYRG